MNHTIASLRRPWFGRTAITALAVISVLVFGQLCVSSVAAGSHAQGGGTIVRCDPASVAGTPGQTLTVDLYVQDVTGLYGLDLRTTFDTTIAQVVDENAGTPGVQFQPLSTFLQPDFVARNVVDNSAGTLRYAATQINPTTPAAGSGPVARIRFTAVKAGHFTLAFTSSALSDIDGKVIPNTAQGCSVAFSNPAAVALSGQDATRDVWGGWWPLVGLGAAAAAYSLLRRRRTL